MIGRLALRSLTAHPVRSAVLAAGFGVGVAVMAILLGVAEIVLSRRSRRRSSAAATCVIRLSPPVPARLLLSGTLQADALRPRMRVAAPSHTTDLYLLHGGKRDARRGARRHPEPGARARRSGDALTSRPGATAGRRRVDDALAGRVLRADRSLPPAFPTRRRGPTRGPSGSTSTGGRRRALLPDVPGRPATASGARAAGVRLQLERTLAWRLRRGRRDGDVHWPRGADRCGTRAARRT